MTVAGREGVIVVGATNDPSRVDPALRRLGRLGCGIEIPLPDEAAREGVLIFHLRGDLDGAELAPVVERTEGMAGAWLEALVRNARRTARRTRREMQLVDLLSALPARLPMPAKTVEMSAIRHAVVALEIGKKELEARVTRDVLADADSFDGGYVRIERPEAEVYLRWKEQVHSMIVQLLGRLAAEDVFFG